MRLPSSPSSARGFISGGLFMPLICLGLLIGGGQGVYTALKNNKPLSITVKDYIAQHPNADWVQLKDADIALLECATSGAFGSVQELFIPVRPIGEKPGAPVSVLLKTKKPAWIEFMKGLHEAEKSGDRAAAMKLIVEKSSELGGTSEVSGLVEFGMSSSSKERSKLERLNMNLTKDYVVIQHDETPSLGLSAGMLIAGLALAWYLVKSSFSKAADAATPPPAPPSLPPHG